MHPDKATSRQRDSCGASVTRPRRGMLWVVSPLLPAPLSLDVSLGLVGVFLECPHGPLHLAFLGGHRAQPVSNRESRPNLLVVSRSRIFARGHKEIMPPGCQLRSAIYHVLVGLHTDYRLYRPGVPLSDDLVPTLMVTPPDSAR